MIRCSDVDLAIALRDRSLPEGSLVFVAEPTIPDQWAAVAAELSEAFELSQAAVRGGGAVAYLVNSDDLLGRRGPGRAMVACGLLSAARSLAIETARAGVPVNVVAVSESTSPEIAGYWVEMLCQPDGPNGELIRLSGDHLGKTVP